jgi:uncharacterized protein (TIGR03437 family)
MNVVRCLRFAAWAFMQTTAFAGALSVNGTCEVGNCVTPDTLGLTGSSDTPFNFVFTFNNSDRFQIQGALAAVGLSILGTQATVTYLGNNSGTASGQDVVTVDFLQNFQSSPPPGAYEELIYGIFGGALASGTSATAQFFAGGIALPLMGPFGPPNSFFATNSALTPGLAATFLADGRATATFGAGSSPGSFVTMSTLPIAATPPAIMQNGIVPVYSTATTIQPGEWVSIFGTNLASGTATWTGNFPISLGGTSVTIDGKAAYLSFVSPGQINLQAPIDATTGPVPVTVTTAGGSATATVTLAQFAPSFLLLDAKHVAGIILRSNGSGAYGGGAYDILGPTGTPLGYATVAAKAGDVVELFGTGFGPTTPAEPAGQAFSGTAATTSPVSLLINNVSVAPLFAGLSGAGLDQINLTVPAGLGTGDIPLMAMVGGVQTPSGVVISLQ